MHGWYGWHMGWWMIWWWVLGLALVVLVFRLLVSGARGPESGRESPEEILKRRYARGEIDRDAYHRMLADLREPPGERERPGPPGGTQHPV